MQAINYNLQSLKYNEAKTYLVAVLFTVGNIAMPQLFHLIPQGGLIWLPIYFFTLIGAYKYGWRVGLLTAIASPVVNSLLFGMPLPAVLPSILIKSVLLALIAGVVAQRSRKASIVYYRGVVHAYQLPVTIGECAKLGDLGVAFQDFRIGVPGMLLQVIGGYLALRLIP